MQAMGARIHAGMKYARLPGIMIYNVLQSVALDVHTYVIVFLLPIV